MVISRYMVDCSLVSLAVSDQIVEANSQVDERVKGFLIVSTCKLSDHFCI